MIKIVVDRYGLRARAYDADDKMIQTFNLVFEASERRTERYAKRMKKPISPLFISSNRHLYFMRLVQGPNSFGIIRGHMDSADTDRVMVAFKKYEDCLGCFNALKDSNLFYEELNECYGIGENTPNSKYLGAANPDYCWEEHPTTSLEQGEWRII
jgi:hypothetical protein